MNSNYSVLDGLMARSCYSNFLQTSAGFELSLTITLVLQDINFFSVVEN